MLKGQGGFLVIKPILPIRNSDTINFLYSLFF